MNSLDRNQKIYIDKESREELFNELCTNENNQTELKYLWSVDNLERYCLGKTGSADYAYSHIKALLKKEYKKWKEYKHNL